jgi:predicted nucleic acid-binding Zn ribbon protein
MYFYSPSEYEKHFHCEVCKEKKDAWNLKVAAARRQNIMEEERQSQQNRTVVK